MRQLIKILAAVFVATLPSSFLYAAENPITVTLEQPFPSYSPSGYASTGYSFRNNLPFPVSLRFSTSVPDYYIFDNCASLASGATCSLTGEFTPTDLGFTELPLTMYNGTDVLPLHSQFISAAAPLSLIWDNDGKFTTLGQTTTLTVTNTLNVPAKITAFHFTNGTISNITEGTQTCLNTTLAPVGQEGDSCTIAYSAQTVASEGYDYLQLSFTVNNQSRTINSPTLRVVTDIQLFNGSTQIDKDSYINLIPDSSSLQAYTLKNLGPFNWSIGRAVLGGIGDPTHLFFDTTCSAVTLAPNDTCNITFNTNITHGGTSIASIDFPEYPLALFVFDQSLANQAIWPLAPFVGQYMQGGVVFWVGPNDPTNPTAPGYRQALVAAVKYAKSAGIFSQKVSSPAVTYTGLFQGASGTSAIPTGLTNTEAICSDDNGGSSTTCLSELQTNYPPAQAAQSYSYIDTSGTLYSGDWFLPAGGGTLGRNCSSGMGEICELILKQAIISATAMAIPARNGSNLVYSLWGSSIVNMNAAVTVDAAQTLYEKYSFANTFFTTWPIRAFSYDVQSQSTGTADTQAANK